MDSQKMKTPKLKNRKVHKTLKIIFDIFYVIMLLFFGLVVVLSIQNKLSGNAVRFGKYQLYAVEGGSMEPNIKKGSVIIISPTETENLRVGDVITFTSPSDNETVVTHRIVKINEGDEITFITRGDANNADDNDLLPANNILGKVHIAIPFIGFLMSFARTKEGLLTLIIIPGVLIIFFEILNLVKASRQLKRRKEDLLLAILNENLIGTTTEGENKMT